MDDPTSSADRLVGWKEIAAFLKRSVRTVQRWERELKLPVRRIRTSDTGQSVFAERQDLQQWLTQQSTALLVENAPGGSSDDPSTAQGETDSPVERPCADDSLPATQTRTPDPSRDARPGYARHWAQRMAVTAAVSGAVLGGAIWLSMGAEDSGRTQIPADALYQVSGNSIDTLDPGNARRTHHFRIPEDAPYAGFRSTGTLSADGRLLAVGTTRADGVALFNVETNRFERWYAVSLPRITSASLSSDGTRLAVLDQNGRISFVDTATGAIAGSVSVPGESFDMLADYAGNGVWIPSRDQGTLSFADFTTLSITQIITTARGAHDIAATADLRLAIVSNLWDESVSCVNLRERKVLTTKLDARPRKVTIASNGRVAYVASHERGWLKTVDPQSCEVLATLRDAHGTGQVQSMVSDELGRRIYVTRTAPSTIGIYDMTAAVPPIVTAPTTTGLGFLLRPRISAKPDNPPGL